MAGVCMRDCAQCSLRQEYGCRGCLESGGQPFWGSCRVVECCHSRGQQNCGQCVNGPSCATVQEAERQREEWPQKDAERRAAWQAGMARRVPVLAQWLPVLFWITLCSTVLNLVDQLPLGEGASLVLNVVSMGLGIGCLVVYWKLSVLSGRLRLVWRLELAAVAVSGVLTVLLLADLIQADLSSGLAILVVVGALAVIVIGMVVLYQFCEAMAEELEQSVSPVPPGGAYRGLFLSLPQKLADDWRLLRKCVFWSIGGLVGSAMLAVLMRGSILMALVMLAAAAVLAGCGVAHLVMLWKSSCFFRDSLRDIPALPEAEP